MSQDEDDPVRGIGPSLRGTLPHQRGLAPAPRSPRPPRAAQRVTGEAEPIDARAYASRASLEKIASRAQAYSRVNVFIIPIANTFERNVGYQQTLRAAVQSSLDSEALAMALQKSAFVFDVTVERERTADEKKNYGRMDFPVYAIGLGSSVDTITSLMADHGIPKRYKGVDQYDYAEKNWGTLRGDYGLGFPAEPLAKRFGKVGFVHYERVRSDCPGTSWKCLANVIVHELFHMSGLPFHGARGLMRPATLDKWTSPVPFSPDDRNRFFAALTLLRHAAVDAG